MVTRHCLRLSLITKVEHIFSASCAKPQQHVRSLTKQLFLCSPLSGPSVYQSVSCITLQPGGNLEHPPAGHSEWTHPRIQGDGQKNKHKNVYMLRIPCDGQRDIKPADDVSSYNCPRDRTPDRQPCLNILTFCPGAILFCYNLQVFCG